ncbi:response regulator [Antarcticibacterium flavum]|uniref:Response regulator n=1 Tax=Antarcticibacterium flavum TaxID=2058175 RepID=A0A5B7X3X9_9FLAO|nr:MULTISPECIES: response regulator [Antarcticibacterium]MCM4161541.1 response regulator [Antarcticibacterium sp. W02-3]QCY69980.1 response regulator [Antarcticibacterium flavum]
MKKKEIFIVEDDDGIRELIEYLLISQDYKVQTFPNAERFKQTIDSRSPDLILLDVMLPDGNGLEICECLGEKERTHNIPVLLMSAHAQVDTQKTANARDFIAKPFDIEDFLHRIEKHVKDHPAA